MLVLLMIAWATAFALLNAGALAGLRRFLDQTGREQEARHTATATKRAPAGPRPPG
jgi:hypothetical protein